MTTATSWFDVSRSGLKQLMEGKDKSFVIRELVQNCWDEPGVTRCNIELHHLDIGLAELVVEDDAPEGFHDIRHAYTLFAETRKRQDPTKRGRFNLGEKQVLALCKEASIKTTTGRISFKADGTREKAAHPRTSSGSVFYAKIRMNKKEIRQCVKAIRSFIPPAHIQTVINSMVVRERDSLKVKSCEAKLTTEYTDDEGSWRKSKRKTTIDVHEVWEGEVPTLYEMGIPVVELEGGDKYHYNVNQRVPLNQDRDNVSPAYLRDLRGEVINLVADLLTEEEASESWVREATATERVEPEAFKAVMEKRFGKKVATFSVNDPEANHRAVSEGYNLISGGSLSRGEWSNVKRFETVRPSSKICPTASPRFGPNGEDIVMPEEEWTPAMDRVARLAQDIASETMGGCMVRFVRSTQGFEAWYGGRELSFNYRRLGKRFFEEYPANRERIISLIIHELAHQEEGNHLSDRYHREVCRLAGAVVELAIKSPRLFKR